MLSPCWWKSRDRRSKQESQSVVKCHEGRRGFASFPRRKKASVPQASGEVGRVEESENVQVLHPVEGPNSPSRRKGRIPLLFRGHLCNVAGGGVGRASLGKEVIISDSSGSRKRGAIDGRRRRARSGRESTGSRGEGGWSRGAEVPKYSRMKAASEEKYRKAR